MTGGTTNGSGDAGTTGATSLGYHDDEVEAARAYDRRAVEVLNEFARLNFRGSGHPNGGRRSVRSGRLRRRRQKEKAKDKSEKAREVRKTCETSGRAGKKKKRPHGLCGRCGRFLRID